jgi:hypothetical protein
MKFDRSKYKPTKAIHLLFQLEYRNVENEIESIKDYLKSAEFNITNLQTNLDKEWNDVKKIDPEDNAGFLDSYYEEFLKFNDFFPKLLYNSTFIWVFSFFENKLKWICETIERYAPIPIKLDSIKGDGIVKYYKYLNRIIVISKDSNRAWEKITDYKLIRNLITHNNSSIIKNKEISFEEQPHYKHMKDGFYFTIDEKKKNFIINSVEYILDFANLINTFLQPIVRYIDEHSVEIGDGKIKV